MLSSFPNPFPRGSRTHPETSGCAAQAAIGAPLSRFVPPLFHAAPYRHVEHFGATDVSERQMELGPTLFGMRAHGEEFPIEASISQVIAKKGKPYPVMLRDITEGVRARQELKAPRDELRQPSARIDTVREEQKKHIARQLRILLSDAARRGRPCP